VHPHISENIQYKLLQTIAAVLIRKIVSFVTPNPKSKQQEDAKNFEMF
jgi:hypothetical protein